MKLDGGHKPCDDLLEGLHRDVIVGCQSGQDSVGRDGGIFGGDDSGRVIFVSIDGGGLLWGVDQVADADVRHVRSEVVVEAFEVSAVPRIWEVDEGGAGLEEAFQVAVASSVEHLLLLCL